MRIIGKIIMDAVQENLELVTLLVLINTLLNLLNIMYGTVIGTKEEGFDVKKFFYGIFKWVLGCFGIIGFAYVLNVLALTLEALEIDFTIKFLGADFTSDKIISIVEVIGILVAWSYDLSKDVIEKIKLMKELKYISYDDFEIQENMYSQEEKG